MMLEKRQQVADKSPLLVAEGLCHAYDTGKEQRVGRVGRVFALKNLDLSLYPGEVVCLLGASGSGKSTALRVLAGLERASSGMVRFDGKIICDETVFVPPNKRPMGLVFQDFALFPHLSVADNIAYGLRRGNGSADERVQELLAAVGLQGYEDKYPHQLSGGEAQRIAVARALAPEPQLILMDEPFSGLDTQLKEGVRDWVLHILKSRNIGAVIVTHDSEEALYMADKIIVIDKGSVVQSGSPDELYLHPVNSFVAEFFGQVNKIHGRVHDGHIDTPFGKMACPNVVDGECANVLFRPEHLLLQECHSGGDIPAGEALARVEAARMLGRSSLVHLQVWYKGDYSVHMHARVPGSYTPAEGKFLQLKLQEGGAFIFHESC